MNVEIGTETPVFFFWEYLFQNFGILSLQCRILCSYWLLHFNMLKNSAKGLLYFGLDCGLLVFFKPSTHGL